CSLIIPMICASVKRLFRIRLLLQKVEQTLHQNEGSFGEQVTSSNMSKARNVTRRKMLLTRSLRLSVDR
ncbi:hypothetical protein, partial [Actibacterium sp. D379-3]